MKSQAINYTLKIFHGQKVERYRTKSLRRFLRYIRTINWQNKGIKVYLRVSYRKKLDVIGRYYNDGWYESETDLWLAFDAFREVDA